MTELRARLARYAERLSSVASRGRSDGARDESCGLSEVEDALRSEALAVPSPIAMERGRRRLLSSLTDPDLGSSIFGS